MQNIMSHPESLVSIDTLRIPTEKVDHVLDRVSMKFRDTIDPHMKQDILNSTGMSEMGQLIAGGSENVWSTKGVPHEPNQPKLHAANDEQFQQAA